MTTKKKNDKRRLSVFAVPSNPTCSEFNQKLADAYENHVRHAYINNLGISTRYLGHLGYCQWCRDFISYINHLGKTEHFKKFPGKYSLQKINPAGPVALSNLTYFGPMVNLVKTKAIHKKILDENVFKKMETVLDLNIKKGDKKSTFSGKGIAREVKGPKQTKITLSHHKETIVYPTREQMPPHFRPYWDESGNKKSLKSICDHLGIPYVEVKKMMDKKRELTLEQATNKVVRRLIESYMDSRYENKHELGWEGFVSRMTSRYHGLSRSQIFRGLHKATHSESGVLNFDLFEKFLNQSMSQQKEIWIWKSSGRFVGHFATVALAAETLNIPAHTLTTLANKDNSSYQGYWASYTDESPSGLDSKIENFELGQMIFSATVPVQDYALSAVQRTILHMNQLEGKSLQNIAEILNMSEALVKHFAYKGAGDLKETIQALLAPKLQNGKGLPSESYKDPNTGEPSSKEANQTISADAKMARELRTRINGATPFTAETGNSVANPQHDKEVEE